MKRFISMLAVAAAVMSALSCQKYPVPVDKDGEFLVYTSPAEGKDFGAFATFTIADSVLIVEPGMDGKMVKNDFCTSLIHEYKTMMEARGYEYLPIEDKAKADLGIQISYMSRTGYVTGIQDPDWWLDYPGFWSPGYWGSWGGGWYYPSRVLYKFMAHSIVADMIDLTSADGKDDKLPVIWNSMINGYASSDIGNDNKRFRIGIRQAFEQSPYLRRTETAPSM